MLGNALAEKASDELSVALTAGAPAAVCCVFEFDHRPRTAVTRKSRRASIDSWRGEFEVVSRDVADELRRDNPRAAMRSCWLNSTLGAAVDRRLLAELAHDPKLERIDVPCALRFHESPRPAAGPPENVVLNGAWRVRDRFGLSGRGVTVGVIDSEVMQDHPALLGRVERGANFSGESFGRPHRHGTAVAGIIAADGSRLAAPPDGVRPFMGVAPGVTIRSYKMPRAIDDLTGARAIERAVEDELPVVNCSWGAVNVAISGTSRVTRACNAAWLAGTAVVKSVGESGEVTAPADATGIIVVGSAGLLGTTMIEHPPHKVILGRLRPDLVAPGDGRPWSLRLDGGVGRVGNGASIAAPHVAGLLALLLEREPRFEPDELRARLLEACRPIGGVPPSHQGHGLVSAELLFGL